MLCGRKPDNGHKQSVHVHIQFDKSHRTHTAWIRHSAGGPVTEVARSESESQRISDTCRRRYNHVCEGNIEYDSWVNLGQFLPYTCIDYYQLIVYNIIKEIVFLGGGYDINAYVL